MEELTQERLKALLDYNSETGIFTRKISIRGGGKVGTKAGCKALNGYVQIRIDGKLYQAHHLVWLYVYGKWPTNQINHINKICDDNKLINLGKYISWKNVELTQERLKALLDYDEETGIFTRKISIRGGGKAGNGVGYKDSLGYIRIMIDGKNYQPHRLVWLYVYGKWPTKRIGHVNNINNDNKLSNLREYINWENVELTQERLKLLLDYDEKTGLFTRKINVRGVKVGDIAGYKNTDGYIRIRIDGKLCQAHRLAWLYVFGKWPTKRIDHINMVRDDNRICNLRDISNKYLQRSRGIPCNNISGIKGVCWHKATNKWRVQIMIDGENKNLGLYTDKLSAVCARYSYELKYDWQKHETFESSAKVYIDKYFKGGEND